MAKPKVVAAEEWQQAVAELLKAEKEATRTLDALAARRRRLAANSRYDESTEAGKGSPGGRRRLSLS